MFPRQQAALAVVAMMLSTPARAPAQFRVAPYIQNPRADAMTLVWFSEANEPGRVVVTRGGVPVATLESSPVEATALTYHSTELTRLAPGTPTTTPFRHAVRLEGLEPATQYEWSVTQGTAQRGASFRTAPAGLAPVRLAVYADSETEPESTNNAVIWPWAGRPNSLTRYVVDQTTGYRENLKLIQRWGPDLVAIAGDLVESGGEQRDWDEFWSHNLGEFGTAASVPILPVLGNHEYYGGPGALGGYNQPRSEESVAKYRTYFEVPSNGAPNPMQEGRYYRLDYGAVSIIVIDACNGSPDRDPDRDTNHFLLGEGDVNGGHAPDFNPGSRQYEWVEGQLAEAAARSPFVFVMLHHAPYSSGPHGVREDTQAGTPVRQLTPLFGKYGVAAVFSGHDEMWERSAVPAQRLRADNSLEDYTIHFYDVGIGGDGLRGASFSNSNPHLAFLVDVHEPEVWSPDGTELLSGGKHYGHLRVEVDRVPGEPRRWRATLTPVIAFPKVRLVEGAPVVEGFEERTYNDVVVIEAEDPSPIAEVTHEHWVVE